MRFILLNPGPVSLQIYDIAGALVRDLGIRQYPHGKHSLLWNGQDNQGQEAVSGTYIVRFQAGAQTINRHITIVK